MKRKGLLLNVILLSCCMCACFGEKSNIDMDDSLKSELESETEQIISPIPKVEILNLADVDTLDEYFRPKDGDGRNQVEGYIVAFTYDEVLIEEGKWITDYTKPNGFRIDMVGERTIEFAEDVQIWGLLDGVSAGWLFVNIPVEDIDNFEAMKGYRGYWIFDLNEEGKIDFAHQAYIP